MYLPGLPKHNCKAFHIVFLIGFIMLPLPYCWTFNLLPILPGWVLSFLKHFDLLHQILPVASLQSWFWIFMNALLLYWSLKSEPGVSLLVSRVVLSRVRKQDNFQSLQLQKEVKREGCVCMCVCVCTLKVVQVSGIIVKRTSKQK
jgi:hypothetical protein